MNNHNEAEDAMEGAFKSLVIVALVVVVVVCGLGYLIVSHLLNLHR